MEDEPDSCVAVLAALVGACIGVVILGLMGRVDLLSVFVAVVPNHGADAALAYPHGPGYAVLGGALTAVMCGLIAADGFGRLARIALRGSSPVGRLAGLLNGVPLLLSAAVPTASLLMAFALLPAISIPFALLGPVVLAASVVADHARAARKPFRH